MTSERATDDESERVEQETIEAVCRNYLGSLPPVERIVRWDQAGLSGATIWQLICSGPERYSLRRWPREHPSVHRLQFIHQVLAQVARAGRPAVASPLTTRGGSTFVRHADHLWEVARWIPGASDFHQHPSVARVQAAAAALAQFHLATETLAIEQAASRGLRERYDLLRQADRIRRETLGRDNRDLPGDLHARLLEILDLLHPRLPALELPLKTAAAADWPLQPCLRDIWSENVLFVGDQVSGLVDFGAVDFEHPSADLARLLGSLAGSDRPLWKHGLDAYRTLRPLAHDALHLVWIFDQSNVSLTGLNWASWLGRQGRRFQSLPRVSERLDAIHMRLIDEATRFPDGAAENVVDWFHPPSRGGPSEP